MEHLLTSHENQAPSARLPAHLRIDFSLVNMFAGCWQCTSLTNGLEELEEHEHQQLLQKQALTKCFQ